jgi:signal transduction histidine kinase
VRRFFVGLRGIGVVIVVAAVVPVLVVALLVASDGRQDSDALVLVAASLATVAVVYGAAELLVVRPLRRLSTAARDVAAGNLETRMGSAGPVNELAQLADVLDDIVQTLALRVDEAERAADERARLVGALVTASEDERERIAGEVHDDVIQSMVAVGIRLQMLKSRVTDPEQAALLESLEQTVEDTIRGIRGLLFDLRPPALDRTGLREVLEELLDETFADGGVDWNLVTSYDAEPPDATRIVLYRIAQEALGNIRRHAGAAHVEVVVEGRDSGFATRVTDDGVGFDLARTRAVTDHLGLTSMRERAVVTGGTFSIDSTLGDGTVLEWWLP